jgi:hypothetical protein
MFFGNELGRGTLVSSFGSTLRHGRQYVAGVEHLEHGPYAVERDGSRADEVISVDLDWCAYLATQCLTSVRHHDNLARNEDLARAGDKPFLQHGGDFKDSDPML